MSYELFISLRYLKAKRKQTFISLITFISIAGVAIGVTALIVVLAVMTGAQNDIRDKIVGANSHIVISSAGPMSAAEAQAARETAMAQDGVRSASPFIFTQAILTSEEKVAGVAIRGVDPADAAALADFGVFMTGGSLDKLDGRYAKVGMEPDDLGDMVEIRRAPIILGRELASLLRVDVGYPVRVVSPMGRMTPAGSAPITREYYVAGLFHAGMYEVDSTVALVSVTEAQALTNLGDRVTGVEVKVHDIYEAPAIAQTIASRLGPMFRARDWQSLNRNLFFALALEKTVIGLILILIIFVAAFNIVSTLIMVTLEKTRDIAILKSMGASRRSIMKIFFLEGFTIGALGTALGVAGGVALCEVLKRYEFVKIPSDVYNLERLPVAMRWEDVALVCAAALVITVFAALYPAWSASRVDPAEALRYE